MQNTIFQKMHILKVLAVPIGKTPYSVCYTETLNGLLGAEVPGLELLFLFSYSSMFRYGRTDYKERFVGPISEIAISIFTSSAFLCTARNISVLGAFYVGLKKHWNDSSS